jgi:hypothetical protein
MSDAAPEISDAEWAERYKAHMVKRLLTPPTSWSSEDAERVANDAWEQVDLADERRNDNEPEEAVDNELSYWTD